MRLTLLFLFLGESGHFNFVRICVCDEMLTFVARYLNCIEKMVGGISNVAEFCLYIFLN